MTIQDQMDHHQGYKFMVISISVRITKDLFHGNTLLQAMGKELLTELLANLRLLFEQKLWLNGHFSVIKWFFKSSRAVTKQNRSDSHFTGRHFLKIMKLLTGVWWNHNHWVCARTIFTLLHAMMGIQSRQSNILVVKKWQNSPTRQIKA